MGGDAACPIMCPCGASIDLHASGCAGLGPSDTAWPAAAVQHSVFSKCEFNGHLGSPPLFLVVPCEPVAPYSSSRPVVHVFPCGQVALAVLVGCMGQ
jgi:hypothetical protein